MVFSDPARREKTSIGGIEPHLRSATARALSSKLRNFRARDDLSFAIEPNITDVSKTSLEPIEVPRRFRARALSLKRLRERCLEQAFEHYPSDGKFPSYSRE